MRLGDRNLERRVVHGLFYELSDTIYILAREDAGVDSQPCVLRQHVILLAALSLGERIGGGHHGVHQRGERQHLEQQSFAYVYVRCEEPQYELGHIGSQPDEHLPDRRDQSERFLCLLQPDRGSSEFSEPCVLRRAGGVAAFLVRSDPVVGKAFLDYSDHRELLLYAERIAAYDGSAFVQYQVKRYASVPERGGDEIRAGHCRDTADLLVLPEAEIDVPFRDVSLIYEALACIHNHDEMVLHIAGAAAPNDLSVIRSGKRRILPC